MIDSSRHEQEARIVPIDTAKVRAVVQGVGHGLPEQVLTNDDLAKIVDTNDAWITQRTGIRERRVTREDESIVDLCSRAALEAIKNSHCQIEDIDMIVVGTVTGDFPSPSVACFVQGQIGAFRAFAFDVSAACAGFIYAVSVATAMIESGQIRTALVIGADTLTKKLQWEDRNTSVLFGDAAGAMVLSASTEEDRGVMGSVLFSDGTGTEAIRVVPEKLDTPGSIHMAGSEVFRFAVQAMGDACSRVVANLGLTMDDIDLFVPHQANLRIIEAAAKRLGLPMEKVFLNVAKYGNTSGGSVPLALYEAEKEGLLKPGMRVMTVGFGAGLVWGANVIRW
ncbi:MAG TPA: beta-ketoacyl-ACP synthase III [Fimbriimonas sp.]